MFDPTKFRAALVDMRITRTGERDRVRANALGPLWTGYELSQAQRSNINRELELIIDLIAAVDVATDSDGVPAVTS